MERRPISRKAFALACKQLCKANASDALRELLRVYNSSNYFGNSNVFDISPRVFRWADDISLVWVVVHSWRHLSWTAKMDNAICCSICANRPDWLEVFLRLTKRFPIEHAVRQTMLHAAWDCLRTVIRYGHKHGKLSWKSVARGKYQAGMKEVVESEFPTVDAPLDRPVSSLGKLSAVAAIATESWKEGERRWLLVGPAKVMELPKHDEPLFFHPPLPRGSAPHHKFRVVDSDGNRVPCTATWCETRPPKKMYLKLPYGGRKLVFLSGKVLML